MNIPSGSGSFWAPVPSTSSRSIGSHIHTWFERDRHPGLAPA
jgi:hypothetical protein